MVKVKFTKGAFVKGVQYVVGDIDVISEEMHCTFMGWGMLNRILVILLGKNLVCQKKIIFQMSTGKKFKGDEQ